MRRDLKRLGTDIATRVLVEYWTNLRARGRPSCNKFRYAYLKPCLGPPPCESQPASPCYVAPCGFWSRRTTQNRLDCGPLEPMVWRKFRIAGLAPPPERG